MKIGTLKSYKETNKSFEVSLFRFAFTLPMWNSINTIFIYPILVAWLLLNNWSEKLNLIKKNFIPLVLLTLIYLLFLSNFLFSDDVSQSSKLALKALPLFIFPLV